MNKFIEAYLDEKLDPETKAAFEAALVQDKALRDAVLQAERIRDDLSWMAIEQGLKQGEQSFWEKLDALKRRKRWTIFVLGFGLVLGGVLGWKWKQTQPLSQPEPQKQENIRPSNADSIQLSNPKVPAPSSDSLKINPKPANRSQVVAKYFSPYKDNSMEPSLRGDAAPSPSEIFQQQYWDGKYQEALVQFETLSTLAKANDNLLFLQAECLMALGKAEQAVPIYEAILERDRTRFEEISTWHLALGYLKMGKSDQAKTQLQKISRSGSKWRGEAAALLKSI